MTLKQDLEADFVEFCRLEYPRLVNALALFCGDIHLAEEVTQEAMARLYGNWKSGSGVVSPRGMGFSCWL